MVKAAGENTVRVGTDVTMSGNEFEYDFSIQLRYSYRLDPAPRHRAAFGKAFGCARVAFNDGLAAREAAHATGLPYVTDAELSARLTAAKKTPERAWLNEVSSVVLQQALADLNAAYRNYFASLRGERKGPKVKPPGSGPARITGRRFTPRTGVTGGNSTPTGRSGGQSPTTPSMASRSRSACPACRAVSSSRCSRTHRSVKRRPSRSGCTESWSRVSAWAAASRLRTQACR